MDLRSLALMAPDALFGQVFSLTLYFLWTVLLWPHRPAQIVSALYLEYSMTLANIHLYIVWLRCLGLSQVIMESSASWVDRCGVRCMGWKLIEGDDTSMSSLSWCFKKSRHLLTPGSLNTHGFLWSLSCSFSDNTASWILLASASGKVSSFGLIWMD